MGDVLWAATQLAPKSNADKIVALAFIMSKPSGEMIFAHRKSRVTGQQAESGIVLKLPGGVL